MSGKYKLYLEEAAKAYDKKALELFKEFARTNEDLGLYKTNKNLRRN